jgi:transaldolase
MQLLIDSTDLNEIRTALSWGIMDGITTNPTLIAKAGPDNEGTLKKLLDISPGVVFAQAVGWKEVAPLKAQAKWLHKLSDRIIVKLPMSVAGIQAVTELKKELPGIRLAVTAVSTVSQAYLIGKAGAEVCALFNGPMDLEQDQPVNLVAPVRKIYDRYGFKTKILTAGRFARGFGESAAEGADMCTMRFEFWKLIFEHSFTDKRMTGFLSDWKGVFGDKTWPTA